MEFQVQSDCFKALSDPIRLSIIFRLCENTLCASELLEELDISQPTLSYHMNYLVKNNIVKINRIKNMHYYRVDCDQLKILIAYLERVTSRLINNKVCQKYAKQNDEK